MGLHDRSQGVDDPEFLALVGADSFNSTFSSSVDQILLEDLAVDLQATEVRFNNDLLHVVLFGQLG